MNDQFTLTPEEKALLESVEAGEWQSVENRDQAIARYRTYAEATVRKDKRINIRISKRDLDLLKKRALEDGIPYQTLISSILHRYVAGRLVEKRSA